MRNGDTTRWSAFQGAIVADFAPWKALLLHLRDVESYPWRFQ